MACKYNRIWYACDCEYCLRISKLYSDLNYFKFYKEVYFKNYDKEILKIEEELKQYGFKI
ncbi:MAG: hypothetical protein ACRCX2_29130 [Paraclostridium sp.]